MKKSLSNPILKAMVTVVLIALFGGIGLFVALERPFGPGRPAEVSPGEKPGEIAGKVPPIPVPPDTRLAVSTSTRQGKYYAYDSRLSQKGLLLFYGREMPRAGWGWDQAYDAAQAHRTTLHTVLSFKAEGARCIIAMEGNELRSTAVTVLLVPGEDAWKGQATRELRISAR